MTSFVYTLLSLFSIALCYCRSTHYSFLQHIMLQVHLFLSFFICFFFKSNEFARFDFYHLTVDSYHRTISSKQKGRCTIQYTPSDSLLIPTASSNNRCLESDSPILCFLQFFFFFISNVPNPKQLSSHYLLYS